MLHKLKKQSFSIVIPSYNEGLNSELLYEEIKQKLINRSYEIIFINDASTDDSKNYFTIIDRDKNVSIVNLELNKGQSFSLFTGVTNAKFSTIVTIDGDLQNDPGDIPMLIDLYFSKKKDNVKLISGIRHNRKDKLIKKISSYFANKIRAYILKDNCPDSACGLKVFDKEIFLKIPYFDGMHRFLPALFLGLGVKTFFTNINHRPRINGYSKYGTLKRLIFGVRDVILVKKMIKNFQKIDL